MSSPQPSLSVSNLQVQVQEQQILRGISLNVQPGEVHAIMGPNGSGKSTLAYTLAGHPAYQVTGGSVKLTTTDSGLPMGDSDTGGQMIDLLELSPDERSQAGLFLAFQYPVEIPGVKVQNFLRQAYNARFAHQPNKLFNKVIDFRTHLQQLAQELDVNPALLKRGLNEGFSGGEKKRLEILQMTVLEPTYAILDETDSGLDIDAIKAVAQGISKNIEKYNTGVIIITHYQRILDYIQPDFVHVVVRGKVVQSGTSELVQQLEKVGYRQWQDEE